MMTYQADTDDQVRPTMAIDQARKRAELDKQFELIVFAGDGHTLAPHQAERNQRVLEWFRRHLQ